MIGQVSGRLRHISCQRLILLHSLKVEELTQEIERMKKHLQATNAKLASTSLSLQEKEDRLAQLRADRKKQLLEVMEMK